jgi:hypothetical protein
VADGNPRMPAIDDCATLEDEVLGVDLGALQVENRVLLGKGGQG